MTRSAPGPRRLPLPLVLLLLAASAGGAEPPRFDGAPLSPLVERIGDGLIDWQQGRYEAEVVAPLPESYRGRPVNPAMAEELALRAAGAVADSVFLQLAARTRVDARHVLRELETDRARIRLLGNIRGRERVRARRVERSGRPALAVTFRVPMRGVGAVTARLYDRVVGGGRGGGHAPPLPDLAGAPVLYIDARGLGVRPALFPRILGPDGRVLYDAAVAGRAKSIHRGVVEYATRDAPSGAALEGGRRARIVRAVAWRPAAGFQRTGDDPGERRKRRPVRAERAAGLRKANIIVGAEEARRLRSAGENWLGEARVIVVTDSALGGTEGRRRRPPRYALFGGR